MFPIDVQHNVDVEEHDGHVDVRCFAAETNQTSFFLSNGADIKKSNADKEREDVKRSIRPLSREAQEPQHAALTVRSVLQHG